MTCDIFARVVINQDFDFLMTEQNCFYRHSFNAHASGILKLVPRFVLFFCTRQTRDTPEYWFLSRDGGRENRKERPRPSPEFQRHRGGRVCKTISEGKMETIALDLLHRTSEIIEYESELEALGYQILCPGIPMIEFVFPLFDFCFRFGPLFDLMFIGKINIIFYSIKM